MKFYVKHFASAITSMYDAKISDRFCNCSNYMGLAEPAIGVFNINGDLVPLCADCLYNRVYSEKWEPILLGENYGYIYTEALSYYGGFYLGDYEIIFTTKPNQVDTDEDLTYRLFEVMEDVSLTVCD